MVKFDEALHRLERLEIELPSWAFGNSGTRFKVFSQPGDTEDTRGEDRGRGAGAPVHRLRPLGGAAHSLGPRRRLRQAAPSTRPTSACGSARSTPTRFRTTTTSWAA